MVAALVAVLLIPTLPSAPGRATDPGGCAIEGAALRYRSGTVVRDVVPAGERVLAVACNGDAARVATNRRLISLVHPRGTAAGAAGGVALATMITDTQLAGEAVAAAVAPDGATGVVYADGTFERLTLAGAAVGIVTVPPAPDALWRTAGVRSHLVLLADDVWAALQTGTTTGATDTSASIIDLRAAQGVGSRAVVRTVKLRTHGRTRVERRDDGWAVTTGRESVLLGLAAAGE